MIVAACILGIVIGFIVGGAWEKGPPAPTPEPPSPAPKKIDFYA